ncbi:hypothetical protein NL466_27970, partial [Klebsiella pneumoniae]|nr:hypothetical protein [Klebsiella pneumoniae]
AIISSFAPAFDRFIVFSQDKEIAPYLLRAAPNTVLASDWSEQYDGAVERAMFEIALMSRCDLIVAGSSGFAQLAGKISEKRVRSADALV